MGKEYALQQIRLKRQSYGGSTIISHAAENSMTVVNLDSRNDCRLEAAAGSKPCTSLTQRRAWDAYVMRTMQQH